MHRPAPLGRALPTLRLKRKSQTEATPTAGGGPTLRAKILGGLLAFLALLVVVALYTPIAHPRDLEVEGATGVSADRIKAAITETAQGQSTFNVSEKDLMAAVADYPEVAEIKINAHPPFRLDLDVVMRPPVGRVQIGGRTFTVAGDGTVLDRASEAAVPKLDPSLGSLLLRDGRLTGDGGALRVLAAAPETLLELIRTLRAGDAGLEIELVRGPRLIFGSADDAKSKWAAATAVIADGAATKATYVDVRVPGRPAVGGLGASKDAGATDAPPSLVAAGTPAAAATVTPSTAPQTATPPASSAPPASAAPSASSSGTAPSATATAPSPATGPGTPSTQAAPPAAPSAGSPQSPASGGASVTGGATP